MYNIINKIYNFYINNKKICIVFVLSIVLLIVIGSSLILDSNNNDNNKENSITQNSNEIEKIVLFGDLEITIDEGQEYIEPGFYTITKSGEIKTDNVEVVNPVDTTKPGIYIITYISGSKKVSRKVEVLEKSKVGTLDFSLKGNSLIVLEQGEEYVEFGYVANDSIDGDITDSVITSGFVDSNVPGTYTITYVVSNSTGKTLELTRKVIVNPVALDVKITLSESGYTNKDITLTINASGSDFYYIKYPNNTVSKNKNSTYKITENGSYKFYIYDNDANYIIEEVLITNIDKTTPVGTCSAKVENGKTYINVSTRDLESGIKNYSFYGNNNLLTSNTNSSFIANQKLNDVYVKVYDNALNEAVINCKIENQYDLEVHFIDVGREDAILIRSSEKTIFIDGGSYSKKNIITPYLKKLGIIKIDVVIGSHLHYNHIQAQADLLANFQIDKIYYPQDLSKCYSTYCDTNDQKYILDAIKKYNKKISIMKVNDNINVGDINIFCIGPIKFQTKSQNKYRQNYNSLNFILTYGDTKFMFTGDHMQSSNILNNFSKGILDVDVLKYPHHGNEEIGKSIINAMTPQYVILTSSKDELSSKDAKKYLQNIGAKFYYSYKHDNILLLSDGSNLTVKTSVNPSDYKR